MADIISPNFVMPAETVMVLADEDTECTGTIARCKISPNNGILFRPVTPKRVIFIRDMAQQVKVNDVDYFLMHADAIVGILPDE